jgi:hypothetical protein
MSGVLATLRPWQVVPPQLATPSLGAARSEQEPEQHGQKQSESAHANRDVTACPRH